MSAAGNSGKVTLLLGGARSGKSALAEKVARRRAGEDGGVLYVATLVPFDDEMVTRVANHRSSRPANWRTVEAPYDLARPVLEAYREEKVVLVDCLTVWTSNLLVRASDPEIGGIAGTDESASTGAPHSALEPDREENITSELQAEMEAAKRQAPSRPEPPQPDYDALEAEVLAQLEELVAGIRRQGAELLLVSNEVGLGLVPPYLLGRIYRDLLGRVNQRLAALADEVYMVFAGIPVELKRLQADLI